jgi:hydroxymethylglutaryl-CoA lyase
MANPAQISRMLEAALPILGEIPLVLHLHDTRGMGLANVSRTGARSPG